MKIAFMNGSVSLKVGSVLLSSLLSMFSVAQAESAPTAVDSLTWLEQPHSKQALVWATQQTQSTVKRLESSPLYQPSKRELNEILASNPVQPVITLMGHRAMRFLVSKEQPFGLLQVADRNASGVQGQWHTVLDVAALRKREGIPYELEAYDFQKSCLAPSFSRCLLRLSPAGGDEVQIREFDLDKAEFVKGGFQVPTSRAFAVWMSQDSVLVETVGADGHKTISGWPADVQLWHRGESLSAAPVVYQAKASDALVELDAAGKGTSRYGVISRAVDYSHFEIHVVRQNGDTEQVPLPNDSMKSMGLQAIGPKALFVQLARDTQVGRKHYAAETLLAYAVDPSVPEAQRLSVVYTPAAGEFIYGFPAGVVATANQVAFVVSQRLVPKVMMAKPTGAAWVTHKVVQAEPGTTVGISASDFDDDLNVTTTGFVTPTRQELYRPGQSQRLLAKDKAIFDGSNYTTEIRSATSKDGTSVDYFLVKPRVPTWKGPQPLLVTGYAAFGISFTPGYFTELVGGPAMKLWLDRGGSVMIPAARGGGERGEAWHQAAMREHRQNSYDDFIAAIQQLTQSGYTTPSRIGIFGMSNGGLLTAVLGTERPDLFGAVVSDVPLTDLIRLKYMGMGAAWLDEYGDAADPAMAKVLESYSPLQNLRARVKYPPFFITTSTSDDRVGPGHARKFAARLESVGTNVYFYEDNEGGHGVSDAFRNPELMALRMTFLISNLMSGKY